MVDYPPNGMEADQCFVTVHWWVRMDLPVLVWWPLLPGRIWVYSSSLIVVMDNENMIESISCPPISRSSTLWTVTGIRKDLFIIIFFFFAVVALRVLLHIDCLMAAWHTSWPHVWFWLAGGSCFRWKPFQVSHIFQGKTFWFLALLFSLLHLPSAIGFFDSLNCAFRS